MNHAGGYLKSFFQQRQFAHQIGDRVGQRIFGRVVWRGLNSQHEFVFERMRLLVGGENDLRIFQQLPGRARWTSRLRQRAFSAGSVDVES